MKPLQQVSDSELELMHILWDRGGSAFLPEIMEQLDIQNKEWKTNTVLTFLSRLVEKGLLKVEKHGRRNEYIVLVSKDDYVSKQTIKLIDKVNAGNAKGLVTALIQQNKLSADDIAEITQFWREGICVE